MTEENSFRGISRWDLCAIIITRSSAPAFLFARAGDRLIGTYSLFAFVACASSSVYRFVFRRSSAGSNQPAECIFTLAKRSDPWSDSRSLALWIVRITTIATIPTRFLISLGSFSPRRPKLVANFGHYIVICLITIVNFIGSRIDVMTNIFTVGKILPLFVSSPAFIFIEPAIHFGESLHTEIRKRFGLIYAFVGFEAAVFLPANERAAQKHAVALLAALFFCRLSFYVIQVVAIGTLPEVASSKRRLPTPPEIYGYFGAAFISVGALVRCSEIGTAVFSPPRAFRCEAEQKSCRGFGENAQNSNAFRSLFWTPR